jgi:hypothetical protein
MFFFEVDSGNVKQLYYLEKILYYQSNNTILPIY